MGKHSILSFLSCLLATVVLLVCLAIFGGSRQPLNLRPNEKTQLGERESTQSSQPVHSSRFPVLAPDENMWAGHPGNNVSVCVVVRTYAGHANKLGAMLASLAAAAHTKTSVFLVDTGAVKPFTSLPTIAKELNELVGFDMFKVSNRTSNNSRPLIPALQGYEDWGYAATDMVLGDLLQLNAEAVKAGLPKPCMALYFTNGDNLMATAFFVATLDKIAGGHNIVGTNYIEYTTQEPSLRNEKDFRNTSECGAWRSGSDVEMYPKFRVTCIDLAAVVTNATLWESGQRGVRFVANSLHSGLVGDAAKRQQWRIYAADGYAFEKLVAIKDANPHIVRRTLFFHQ
jgi:hypothetical protein